jgi:hypothetical protein
MRKLIIIILILAASIAAFGQQQQFTGKVFTNTYTGSDDTSYILALQGNTTMQSRTDEEFTEVLSSPVPDAFIRTRAGRRSGSVSGTAGLTATSRI